MNENRIFVLTCFHGLNVEDIFAYTGPEGKQLAMVHFEEKTGISYIHYAKRMEEGEGNQDILDEDDEGTEIYVVTPLSDRIQLNHLAEGGTALWSDK